MVPGLLVVGTLIALNVILLARNLWFSPAMKIRDLDYVESVRTPINPPIDHCFVCPICFSSKVHAQLLEVMANASVKFACDSCDNTWYTHSSRVNGYVVKFSQYVEVMSHVEWEKKFGDPIMLPVEFLPGKKPGDLGNIHLVDDPAQVLADKIRRLRDNEGYGHVSPDLIQSQ